MTTRHCQNEGCGRIYDKGGTKEDCPKCYMAKRREKTRKRPADPERGRRTVARQVWMTPEMDSAIGELHPDPVNAGTWIRALVAAELSRLDHKAHVEAFTKAGK